MRPPSLLILLIQLTLLASCATTTPISLKPKPKPGPGQYEVFGEIYTLRPSSLGYVEIGVASWYGKKFHGRLTANGEVYDMFSISAAHKSLPLPTVAKVTNLDNGKSIVVRINDRGPFHDDRLIDLSWAAARELGFEDQGTAPVVVEALDNVNYPHLVEKHEHKTYYLQVGAFSRQAGAEKQLSAVRQALPEDVPVRILTSETESGLLYKVWIGPMESDEEGHHVASRIADRNLGNPVRVTVDYSD